MSGVEVNRSIQFVSLDTHPANNALVVTYEISASVVDHANQLEMTQRNKREQLLINISVLDKLTRNDLKADKLVINLKKLSEEIVSKCPMLLSERHNLEDIQLHLLYLINRRQSQLLAETDKQTGGAAAAGGPNSASIQRLRSAKGAHMTRRSAGYSRKNNSNSISNANDSDELDVFEYLQSKESNQPANYLDHDELLDYFVLSFDEHLTNMECRPSATTCHGDLFDANNIDLEICLEGLYGDKAEKLRSMASLRQLSKTNLSRMSSNRLLVCAMLRTLRDSDLKSELNLRQSIMFCLIKFTTYEDTYKQAFTNGDQPIDLVKLVTDFLFDQTFLLTGGGDGDGDGDGNGGDLQSNLQSMNDEVYFYTTSLVLLMGNLFKIDSSNNHNQILRTLLSHSQQQKVKWACLFELLQLISGQFMKELHLTTTNNTTVLLSVRRSIDLLNGLINILIHLSIFKEFIQQIRTSDTRSQQLIASSLINLMSFLQFIRTGCDGKRPTGVTKSHQQPPNYESKNQPLNELVFNDKQTLNEIYELEMKLIRLINNLIHEQRFRAKLIRKNLLKCVLRNLVVFLASSRKSNSLSGFHQSAVLLEPFKCLYELSCLNEIKLELYKSKIIIKCLLEYLVSSTVDLRSLLDNRLNSISASTLEKMLEPAMVRSAEDHVEIVVEAKSVHQLIISLWVNLSSQSGASIYGNDVHLNQLVCEYIELSLNNFSIFATIIKKNRWSKTLSWTDDELILLYLHAKLFRNVSQFFGLNCIGTPELVDCFIDWTDKLGGLICELLSPSKQSTSCLAPVALECLATLCNFIIAGKTISSKQPENLIKKQTRWPDEKILADLLEKLFSVNSHDLDQTENDDLILVFVSLLAAIARYCEICQLIEREPKLIAKIIRASNVIFETRMTDHQMVVSSLCTLCQLTDHAAFLRELSNCEQSGKGESCSLANQVEQLVDKLAHLMLNGHQSMVAKLASYLLIRLEQLDRLTDYGGSGAFSAYVEDDDDDDDIEVEAKRRLIRKKRFSSYNSKWLDTIRASRDESSSSSITKTNTCSADDQSGEKQHEFEIYQDEDAEESEVNDDGDDDCFKLLRRQVGSSRSQSRLLTSFADDLGAGQVKLFGADELSEGSSGRTTATAKRNGLVEVEKGSSSELDSDEDNDGDDQDDDYEERRLEGREEDEDGPDFNVVDANSMIKHLTSRREFRSKWLKH